MTNFTRFQESCVLAHDIANDVKVLKAKIDRLQAFHSANGFGDSGDETKPSYINEDTDGNIQGLQFSRLDYSTLIGAVTQISTLFSANDSAIQKIADA